MEHSKENGLSASVGHEFQDGIPVLHEAYRTLSVVSSDATGVLFRAEHKYKKDKVAIKLVPQKLTIGKSARFHVSHPQILEILDVINLLDGNQLVVLKRPRGTCLEKVISSQRRIKTKQVISIVKKLLALLADLHQQRLVHGSLNTSAVFLSRSLKRSLEVELLYLGLEGEGAGLNDPNYLSPEQVTAPNHYDEASDIWAVGVILFRLAFGALPFEGTTQEETIGRILLEEIVIPSEFAGRKSAVASVVRRALCKDPAERYPNAAAMIADLDAALEDPDKTSSAPKASLPIGLHDEPQKKGPPATAFAKAPPPLPRKKVPVPSRKAPPPLIAEPRMAKEAIVEGEKEGLETFVVDDPESYLDEVQETLSDHDGAKTAKGAQSEHKESIEEQADEDITLEDISIANQISQKERETAAREDYVSVDPDTTNPSVQSSILASEERRQFGRTRRSKTALAFAGGALAAMVVFGTLSVLDHFKADAERSDIQAASPMPIDGVEKTEPVIGEAASKTVKPGDQDKAPSMVSKNERAENGDPAAAQSNGEKVTITFDNLLLGTPIMVDGQMMENPITLSKSMDPVVLKIMPRSRRSFKYTVVPDETRHVTIKSKKSKQKKSSDSTQTSSQSASEKTSGVKSGNLSSNPFKLKNNPFPTGD